MARRELPAWARRRRLPAEPEGSRGRRSRAPKRHGGGTPGSAPAAWWLRITGITEITGEKQLRAAVPLHARSGIRIHPWLPIRFSTAKPTPEILSPCSRTLPPSSPTGAMPGRARCGCWRRWSRRTWNGRRRPGPAERLTKPHVAARGVPGEPGKEGEWQRSGDYAKRA